jgi:hypothetical protein
MAEDLEFHEAEDIRTFVYDLMIAWDCPISEATPASIELSSEFLQFAAHGVDGGDVDGGGELQKYVNARHRWIIKDDDLQLLESLTRGAQAAAGAGFFAAGMPSTTVVAAAVGVAVAVFKMIRQVLRKGARVEQRQREILLLLKANPKGMTADQLLAALNASAKANWSLAEVETELTKLEKVRLSDGTVVAFVAVATDRTWSCAGA